ncbi:hypothetical protein [Halarcobacter ebronensis]|uniref:hypothetical protein n=1 Tax=Halarcobacter ebronensis TaxID=1462615 RepID=UPI0013E98B79|nr:hypothetical protein [Halarcobacter ebronensis]
MFEKFKSIFKKEKTYSCIIFDGKMMSYPQLTKKRIDEINNDPKYKNWQVMIQEDKLK